MENSSKKEKRINKKKLTLAILIILLIITMTTLFIIYCMNAKFRNWTDKNILRKEIKQDNTISIEFGRENNSNVYAFNKSIVVLENKVLKIYDSLGTEQESIKTDISNPIFNTAGKYLIVAEKEGESIYLLQDKKVLWSTKIEGSIVEVQINENGYVGIIISDMSFKNIVSIYNTEGQNLFKTYIATNKVVDISISRNNKLLAIAEVDLSGVLIQSSIKVIDIEKAKIDPSNSIVNTHVARVGKLITNIEYQSKERLLCVYNNSINIIEENEDKSLIDLENTNITFASATLKNNVVTVEEKESSEYASKSFVNITNVSTKKVKTYETVEIAKAIYSYENIIALNFGTELHIINTNGWLMKKYISEQEINQVVISNEIVGIIYRDKIEIIDL